jgi:hypothetical protein
VVEGAKGVWSISEDVIKLNLGKSVVRFVGSGLSMNSYRFEQAVISGNILPLSFCNAAGGLNVFIQVF